MPMIDADESPVLNKPLTRPISDRRRELMHRAMDGMTELGPTMFILHHYTHCDNILTWLILNGWTGKNLADRIVRQFGSSIPQLVDYVVAAANGEVQSNEREGVT